MIGRGPVGDAAETVIIAHDALQNGNLAAVGGLGQQMAGRVFRRKEQIQIAAFGPNDLAVEQGVDVVGTAFTGGGVHPTVDQCLQQAANHGGFARAAFGGRQQDTGQRTFHQPRPLAEISQMGF